MNAGLVYGSCASCLPHRPKTFFIFFMSDDDCYFLGDSRVDGAVRILLC